jgi:hypothetical protein
VIVPDGCDRPPEVARLGAGSTGPGSLLVGTVAGRLAAGDGGGRVAGQDGDDQGAPGAGSAQVQRDATAGDGEPSGDGEESKPHPLRFPPASLVSGQGEGL